nr:hypothetical protein [Tanacetum cinerariifolium]
MLVTQLPPYQMIPLQIKGLDNEQQDVKNGQTKKTTLGEAQSATAWKKVERGCSRKRPENTNTQIPESSSAQSHDLSPIVLIRVVCISRGKNRFLFRRMINMLPTCGTTP